MKICGLKLTHDAAVAVIEDGKLLFSVELEKLDNNDRYTAWKGDRIDRILLDFGLTSADIDVFVIDGWRESTVRLNDKNYPVAPYHEFDGRHTDLLQREEFQEYVSYRHLAGHVIGAYVTSPFAQRGEPSYVLTWDGGTQPRVHFVDVLNKEQPIKFLDTLFPFYGTFYMVMGLYFGPYKKEEIIAYTGEDCRSMIRKHGSYGIPGKLMSYIALGKSDEGLIRWMQDYPATFDQVGYASDAAEVFHFKFLRRLYEFVNLPSERKLSDADVLSSIHEFIERLLVGCALLTIPEGANLCYIGGSALNIKWNSALREHYPNIWIPPFPNDCGSAIGMAACEMVTQTGNWKLDWNTYSGPMIQQRGLVLVGWSAIICPIERLAQLISEHPSEPVVVLTGRAELGPRALGHRSIFCSAELATNKDMINRIKQREFFRPVAPICMEKYAPDIFDPGTPDPYMLFDHKVRSEYLNVIPAIVHLDDTARLQTINREQCPIIYNLLSAYYDITGIPLLCNTSANFPGKGFFPDVESAMVWGCAKYIWSEGVLYEKS